MQGSKEQKVKQMDIKLAPSIASVPERQECIKMKEKVVIKINQRPEEQRASACVKKDSEEEKKNR
jgi:hypothetical protein